METNDNYSDDFISRIPNQGSIALLIARIITVIGIAVLVFLLIIILNKIQ